MSKEIQMNTLNQYETNYQNDKQAKAMRRALAKNELDSIAFVSESTANTKCQFSIDIPTLKVANQQASGRCWLFAGLNIVREEVAKKCELEEFELSQNYVSFYDKLEKINYMMETCIELKDRPADDRTLTWVLQTGVQDGGQWDMLVSVIQKYGVVPQSVMPETYQSNHTRTMNQLINTKMRQFCAKIRHLSDEEIQALKEKTLEEMYGLLCTCFGVPPKTFDFEYVDKHSNCHCVKDLDPHTFYEKYVGIDLNDYISIINAPTKDKPFNHIFTVTYLGNVVGGNPICYLNLELNEFKTLVLKQLQHKELVWFGCDCGKDGDRQLGIWDDQAYDYQSAFNIDFSMSKEDMLDYRQAAMNHAMVFTGVNVEEDHPTKWKVENTWGDDKANKGYYVMSDTWFDRYVFQAVVNKKYLSQAQLELLNSEVIALNPWDPMGTLAK